MYRLTISAGEDFSSLQLHQGFWPDVVRVVLYDGDIEFGRAGYARLGDSMSIFGMEFGVRQLAVQGCWMRTHALRRDTHQQQFVAAMRAIEHVFSTRNELPGLDEICSLVADRLDDWRVEQL